MSASEVMASEFEAAAERWLTPARGVVDLGKRHAAALLLADWAVTRLAADRAEREERARPIDVEWLRSVGFVDYGIRGDIRWRCGQSQVEYFIDSRQFVVNAHVYEPGVFATRGEIGDLLRVLKGGAE